MSSARLERINDLTEQECKRLLAIGQPPAVTVALERRLRGFAFERARQNAMAVLLKCTPAQRVRAAAGLLFSAAAEDDNPGRQAELNDLSSNAEQLAGEL